MTTPSVNKITGCMLTAAALVCFTPAGFGSIKVSQPGKSTAPNSNANQLGELSAAWWQWIWSFKVGTDQNFTNPNFQNGPVDCSYGQSSHTRSGQIWFMAGSFGTVTGPLERTCTSPIPRGVALFFPLPNVDVDNVGCCGPNVPPTTFNIEQLKQFAASYVDAIPYPYCTDNGKPVPVYRAQSPVFSYTLPAVDNVYQSFGFFDIPGVNWPGTTVFPAVSDGYWLMLESLSPGQHDVKCGSSSTAIDMTYHLTVAP